MHHISNYFKTTFCISILSIIVNLYLPTKIYASNIDITVNPSNIQLEIPTDFLGLSISNMRLCELTKMSKANTVLSNLMKNISPAVFRISASSYAENNHATAPSWDDSDGATCSDKVITPSIVDEMGRLAKNTNWKLMWGISLPTKPINKVVAEAQYVTSKINQSLYSLEFVNEPELTYGYKDPSQYTKYITDWKNATTAVKNAIPTTNITGPSAAGMDFEYTRKFIADQKVDSKNTVSQITYHTYPAGTRNENDPNDAAKKLAYLLDSTKMDTQINLIKQALAEIKDNNLTLRINEMNSTSGGGTLGASNTFASTLWSTDYMFDLLEIGVRGVNFHSNPTAIETPYYSPIFNMLPGNEQRPFAKPLYYSMLLFKYVASNGNILPVNSNTALNIRSHAVINKNGNLQVIFINKEQTKTGNANINTTVPYPRYQVIRLLAPSLTSTITSPYSKDITLGGSAVTVGGNWSPTVIENRTINSNRSTITLPPLSVTVVTYIPGDKSIDKIGDANSDGKIDLVDFQIWKDEYLRVNTTQKSDFNKDSIINLVDFNIWKNEYLK